MAELLASLKVCTTPAEAHTIIRQLVSVYELDPCEIDMMLGNNRDRCVWLYAQGQVLQVFIGTRAKYVTDILDPLHVTFHEMGDRMATCEFSHEFTRPPAKGT